MTTAHDFDLHGVVRVRLLDATAADLAKVHRQLGLPSEPPSGEPDVVVRFTDRVATGPVTYVGVGETGYDEEGFLLLRGRGGVPARARLPLDRIGACPQLLCERRMPAVPHLLAIINLTALTKGVLPLHASAFISGSLGVLVTGWAKGGKTEALLAGMAAGGVYVGDEWVYLTPDQRMFGLPEPIRLWDWQLRQQPSLLRSRPGPDRTRLAAWRTAAKVAAAASRPPVPGARLAARAAPSVSRQAYLQVPPAELFGPDRVALRGRMDGVVLVLTHDRPEITTTWAGPTEVSDRMLSSLHDERAPFLAHYRQFRFAFPDRSSAVVESVRSREAALLGALFDQQPAAKVAHPYPCDIAAVGRAVLAAAQESADHRVARHGGVRRASA